VLAYVIRVGSLKLFKKFKRSEPQLNNWFVSLVTHVSVACTGQGRYINTQTLFGLRGALAYTDPNHGTSHSRAGYLGKADVVFPCGAEIFGAAELKMAGEGRIIWYKARAILAQIICSMSGTIDCRVGLILTDGGWKLLYRIPRDLPTEMGDIVFDYYLFPPDEDTGMSFYQPCNNAGLKTLVRIVYELMKVVTMPQVDKPEAVKTAKAGAKVDKKTKKQLRPQISDPKPKRSKSGAGSQDNNENTRTHAINFSTDVEVETHQPEMSSYRFMIAKADGSFKPLGSFHFQPDFF